MWAYFHSSDKFVSDHERFLRPEREGFWILREDALKFKTFPLLQYLLSSGKYFGFLDDQVLLYELLQETLL